MAILRAKEIRKMEAGELARKTEELRKELIKLKAQASMGTAPESPGKIKAIKKTIARVLTIKHQMSNTKPEEETKKL
jgi:large subunit ribosomal protein L29